MYFKKHNCQAGTCKEEEDYIKSSRMSYQMLQTLTDITDDEIVKIASPAIDRIQDITSNVSSMLDAFGATKGRPSLTPFQESLLIYPEMLNDKYCKRKLNDIKNSLIRDYHGGKLPVKGKYTFVLPDLYAFCEHLFLHIDKPNGLLKDGEVSCRLYKRAEKLDCLRSPHLYREHAVRKNVYSETIEKWFQTDAVYTSCFDMISKVLQFDCDGDTLLVVADKTIIEVAERNMVGIVPLYYDMKKAEATILTNEEFYKGMTAAWTGGNIGEISNDITKIWNSGKIGKHELLAVKLLCAENNFVIDYAKTLYKPTRPDYIDDFIKKYTRSKMPRFFMEAKGYEKRQVMSANGSFVNQLRKIIKKKRISFKRFDTFNYKLFMSNVDYNMDSDLIREYEMLCAQYSYKVNNEDEQDNNIPYLMLDIKNKLAKYNYSDEQIVNTLVQHLYGTDSEAKMLLWACYGNILLSNLKNNFKSDESYCRKCGTRFKARSQAHHYCDKCFAERRLKPDERILICKDCGKAFTVPKSVRNKKRCDECQEVHKKQVVSEKNARYYAKTKN